MTFSQRFSPESPQRFAGFAMVGDADVRLEKCRDHLSPTIEWFERLIRGSGISHDVKGWKIDPLFRYRGQKRRDANW